MEIYRYTGLFRVKSHFFIGKQLQKASEIHSGEEVHAIAMNETRKHHKITRREHEGSDNNSTRKRISSRFMPADKQKKNQNTDISSIKLAACE